ncbi:Hpt domain-containing protein [Paractinoplanes globisporus]|uniref:Hpt domain-containing protein n=1 Tax=Paractinoplanes globisporus TaxID=113565 RepID=A0ABW6WEM5_9ACTN|nr:Hpt domain-containing protein [Actinoplanes globisporus]
MDVSTREGEIRARLADIGGDEPGPAERELLARLIRSFAGKVPGGVDRLAELLRGGDLAAVRDHAHGLKGSASNIGAGTLSGIFAEVEQSARDGVIPDADLTLGRVCAEQALVLGLLEGLAREMDQ